MKSDIKKIILKKIKQYETIVIARHIGPDPDAICSQIALRDFILDNYPKKKVYAVGSGVAKFKKYGLLDKVDNKSLKNVLLITLDVPNFYRIDGIEDLKLTNKVAANLFCGIVSDSDRFLLSYTTIETFKIVTNLLERTKIPFHELYAKLYERPLEEIRFHGYIATNLEVTKNGFASIIIDDEIIKKYNVDVSTASNMVNDFNFIKDINVWAFVTYDEKNNLYKVNIRSKGPVINEIASKYHGGGHKFASGVRTPNKEDIDSLFKDLDLECQNYNEKKNND